MILRTGRKEETRESTGAATGRRRWPLWIIWPVVVFSFTLLVWKNDVYLRDPDSRLYSHLGQKLAGLPIAAWVAPKWGGEWNSQGLFREHPPASLWVTAFFVRLGFPAEQAAPIANFIYYLITFLFLYKLGAYAGGPALGWGMVWASLLTPVTLQYLIRANLEPPLTMTIVASIYFYLRADRSRPARLGFVLAQLLAVFFKGLFGLSVAVLAALFWLFWGRDKIRLYTLAGGLAVTLVFCLLFEWYYRAQTGGETFWLAYLHNQTATAVQSHSAFAKLKNLVWYLGRTLYFAFPWSLLLVAAAWWRSNTSYPLARNSVWKWLTLSSFLLIGIMSFFERKADRYIFPAYTLLAAAGAWYGLERFAALRTWLERRRSTMVLRFAGCLLLAVVLKIYSRYFYTNIQLWRN